MDENLCMEHKDIPTQNLACLKRLDTEQNASACEYECVSVCERVSVSMD